MGKREFNPPPVPNEEGFLYLYTTFRRKALPFARSMVGQQAEDCVQEALSRLFPIWCDKERYAAILSHGGKNDGNPITHGLVVLRNIALDALRRTGREREYLAREREEVETQRREEGNPFSRNNHPPEAPLLDACEQEERKARIKQYSAEARLSDIEQEIMWLVEGEDHSLEEAAGILDIEYATARKRHARARQKIEAWKKQEEAKREQAQQWLTPGH